jgi:hypothetical protein
LQGKKERFGNFFSSVYRYARHLAIDEGYDADYTEYFLAGIDEAVRFAGQYRNGITRFKRYIFFTASECTFAGNYEYFMFPGVLVGRYTACRLYLEYTHHEGRGAFFRSGYDTPDHTRYYFDAFDLTVVLYFQCISSLNCMPEFRLPGNYR